MIISDRHTFVLNLTTSKIGLKENRGHRASRTVTFSRKSTKGDITEEERRYLERERKYSYEYRLMRKGRNNIEEA